MGKLTSTVESKLAGCQYAYQRQRSTGLLLADPDARIQDGSTRGQMIHFLGSDIEGAFDNANFIRLMGDWMRARFLEDLADFLAIG